MSARERVERALLGLSYHCGGPRLWDVLRGGRTKVLMYHGVPAREQFAGIVNLYGYNVPQREFAQHMRYLAKRCNVVSLRDFAAGKLCPRGRTNVVLTFDDGYGNNYYNAWPVLQQLGLPATFALTTGFVLRGEPLYNDVVEYAIEHASVPSVRLTLRGVEREFRLADRAGRVELYNHLMYQCVSMAQEQRAALIAAAAQKLGVVVDAASLFADPDYQPMTPAQIAEMARSPLVEFASHSVHHYLLSNAAPDTVRRELEQSKGEVEQLTGVPCTSFCVPGGSYDDAMVQAAYAAGYQNLLCSDVGIAERGARVLKRHGVFHKPNLYWFADVVRGPVHELLGAARRWFRAG